MTHENSTTIDSRGVRSVVSCGGWSLLSVDDILKHLGAQQSHEELGHERGLVVEDGSSGSAVQIKGSRRLDPTKTARAAIQLEGTETARFRFEKSDLGVPGANHIVACSSLIVCLDQNPSCAIVDRDGDGGHHGGSWLSGHRREPPDRCGGLGL